MITIRGMATETLMTFGDKLKGLREARGWTQQQLADRAGVPLPTLRGLEQGQRSPSWGTVVMLARAFDANSAIFDECDEVTPAALKKRRRPKK
jgi:transcriptional regulator with XRE-family HTH domain